MNKKVLVGIMFISTFVISGCETEYDKCIKANEEREKDCYARAHNDKWARVACGNESLEEVMYCNRRYCENGKCE